LSYDYKRFSVLARRRSTRGAWSNWTEVNNFDDAVKQAKKAEAAGYEAKIVDKGEINPC
jgi:hypothetical protein